MTLQGYKFVSNEYRLAAFQMKVHLCHEAKLDRFGIAETFQKAVNFKLACPVKKVSIYRRQEKLGNLI